MFKRLNFVTVRASCQINMNTFMCTMCNCACTVHVLHGTHLLLSTVLSQKRNLWFCLKCILSVIIAILFIVNRTDLLWISWQFFSYVFQPCLNRVRNWSSFKLLPILFWVKISKWNFLRPVKYIYLMLEITCRQNSPYIATVCDNQRFPMFYCFSYL